MTNRCSTVSTGPGARDLGTMRGAPRHQLVSHALEEHMRSNSLTAAVFTLALALAAAGCGKKDPASPTPSGGPRFNLTFTTAGPNGTSQHLQINDVGTWNYACTPHGSGGMTGTIVVAAAAADSATIAVGPGNTFSFSPQTVTIKPGGHVRWQNQSNRTDHTATR